MRLPAFDLLHSLLAFIAFGLAVQLAGATETASTPVIFVVGDSTAHNSGKAKNGQPLVGWGTPLTDYFDANKVHIANVAHAGQSSRSFFNVASDWPTVLPQIKAGDYVLLVFGINDGGPPQEPRSRGSLPGLGDETIDVTKPDGTTETVHTYGWYMRQMATHAREKGAHVYLLTVTTRNIWTNPKAKFRDATPIGPLPNDYNRADDRIERGTSHGEYTQWTKELGAKLHLPVLDLTNLCADRYEEMGREAVNALYNDHNHTYHAGAELIAECVVSGLKAFPNSPFAPLLSDRGKAVAPADSKYVAANAAK